MAVTAAGLKQKPIHYKGIILYYSKTNKSYELGKGRMVENMANTMYIDRVIFTSTNAQRAWTMFKLTIRDRFGCNVKELKRAGKLSY